MPWTEILALCRKDQSHQDGQTPGFLHLVAGHRGRIYCEKGCCNCCSLMVNCSFPEVLKLSRGLTPSQRQCLEGKLPALREVSEQAVDLREFLRLYRERLGSCAFLDSEDGSCGVYQQRPFSCRALLSTRNSSWCAVDFTSLHPMEREAFLSSLDRDLVDFPTHYLAASRQLGLELETRALQAMAEKFGLSLSGNLLYLCWLEIEHRLSELIPQGLEATRSYLNRHQLDRPYLLTLQGA